MKSIKMTKNRLLILRLLGEEILGTRPPHSVEGLYHTIKSLYEYGYKDYPRPTNMPDKRNINRTCVDLLNAGLIIVSRIKHSGYGVSLPFWEKQYQLIEEFVIPIQELLIEECDLLNTEVERLFIKNDSLTKEEIDIYRKRIKTLMHKTHPDKVSGCGEEFITMKKLLAKLKQYN